MSVAVAGGGRPLLARQLQPLRVQDLEVRQRGATGGARREALQQLLCRRLCKRDEITVSEVFAKSRRFYPVTKSSVHRG